MLQQIIAREIGALDDAVHIIDGFPIPVCWLEQGRNRASKEQQVMEDAPQKRAFILALKDIS